MTHDFNQQAHPLLPSLQIENSYVIRATPAGGDLMQNAIQLKNLKIGGAVAVGISYSAHIMRLPSSPKLVITFSTPGIALGVSLPHTGKCNRSAKDFKYAKKQ